ncbi:MAG TPA: YfiR family protein [Rhodanobacteraceae bacterium]|nr:YfiR family protein [Rhodanobacteraceae bacterium]
MTPRRQRESNTPLQAALPPRNVRVAKCVIALALACASGEILAQPMPSNISLEYAVKATYLYKLAPFVNWPPTTFTAANVPFEICVVGEDPFNDFLEKAVTGQHFGTHPFAVRKLDTLTPGTDCQIVFISHLSSQSISDALQAVNGEPVMTVTDSGATPDDGGIMHFVIEQGRVRFEIDTAAAGRNHLTISSKLLNLAVVVRDAG